MTDEEFLEEMAARLNLFIEGDAKRAHVTLATPLTHAGYASVGHFLGQLCSPRGITEKTEADLLQNVKFLMPEFDEGRITGFQAVTGADLQKRVAEGAQKAQAAAAQKKDKSKVH